MDNVLVVHKIAKSILVPYTPLELFAIVNDVVSYPSFMPWCGGAEIREVTDSGLVASITIAFGTIKQTFTTRNENDPPQQISVHLVDGPFKALRGHWEFRPIGDSACKVMLDLEYEFKNIGLEAVVGPVFGLIANTLVDSFAKRAEALYGERT